MRGKSPNRLLGVLFPTTYILGGMSKGINKGKKMVLRNLFLRGISAEDGAAIVEMDISAVREMFRQWR